MSPLSLAVRMRRERGVISLMTLAFMLLAGVSLLVTLWGIARVTGAFNTLYTANESASYAALSASEIYDDKVKVECQNLRAVASEPPTICVKQADSDKYKALAAAEAVLKRSLEKQPFGLCYDGLPVGGPCNGTGEVRLVADYVDSSSWQPSIKVFNMGQVTNPLACRGPGGVAAVPAGKDMISGSGASGSAIVCWSLREYGQAYKPNFNTGVITRAQVQVDFFPSCLNTSLCPKTEIRVASAATQDQPVPGRSYWAP